MKTYDSLYSTICKLFSTLWFHIHVFEIIFQNVIRRAILLVNYNVIREKPNRMQYKQLCTVLKRFHLKRCWLRFVPNPCQTWTVTNCTLILNLWLKLNGLYPKYGCSLNVAMCDILWTRLLWNYITKVFKMIALYPKINRVTFLLGICSSKTAIKQTHSGISCSFHSYERFWR